MILKGQPAMFGVTFDAAGMFVAARVFDSAGTPLSAWTAMANYDGYSYQIPLTFAAAGAYSVRKVAFTDGTFTTRDSNYSEAEDAIQVVDLSTIVQAAVQAGMLDASPAQAVGYLEAGSMVGTVQSVEPIVGIAEED